MIDKLISIIIPNEQEQTYLIRCLNAIKRQTYQNYEIILVTEQCEENLQEQYNLKIVKVGDKGKWKGMQQAIENACGEYLYFCSMSSVLAPNTLEELLKDELNEDKHSMAQFMMLKGKNVEHADREVTELGIYGKLFQNSRIQDEKIVFQEEMEYADYLFASFYEQNYEKIEENAYVYIYETNREFFSDSNRLIAGDEEENMLLMQAQRDNRYLKKLVVALEKRISNEVESDRILHRVISIANAFPKAYGINYELAQKYLKRIFESCQKEENEEDFQKFQTYFKGMEGEKYFFRTLLENFELNDEKYEYLKECSVKEYLFFRDRINEGKKQEEDNYLRLVESVKNLGVEKNYLRLQESVKKLEANASVVEDLRRLVSEIDSIRNTVSTMNTNLQVAPEELTGTMLAEFVVDKYKNGALGLKTLLLSLKVWIAYKFRKGR